MTDFVLDPKQALAVIVMIAFIMVCVLAPFGAAHAIVGVSTAAATILIAALAAAGITFTTSGVFNTIEEYVESLLQEYAQDNNIPITSIFNGSSWQTNAAGKLLLNNVFVRQISAIATWIKVKFSLVDNDTVTAIPSGATINGYTTYELPLEFIDQRNGYYYRLDYTHTSGSFTPVCLILDSGDTYQFRFIAEGTGTVHATRVRSSDNQTSTHDLILAQTNGTTMFWTTGFWNPSKSTTNISGMVTYPSSQWDSIIGSAASIDINNIGIDIKTGTIDIPTDRTDYTSTSGAILDVHAPWSIPVSGVIDTIPDAWSSVQDDTTVYTLDVVEEAVIEQQLPQPSDIENLPGATIPGLPDIDGEPWHLEFSNLWHYVAQWISDMSAGGAVIWNTCVQAPPPIVNLVFVGIVLAMWFGAIKILR